MTAKARQTKKRAPLTWPRRIAYALRRGRFTEDDNRLVGEWNTCAIGEARRSKRPKSVIAVLGRGRSEPDDDALIRLGMSFMYDVRGDTVPKARETYRGIQKRLDELARADS